jgi:hypothetical protein
MTCENMIDLPSPEKSEAADALLGVKLKTIAGTGQYRDRHSGTHTAGLHEP